MKKNEKCLELPDLARKLIKKSFKIFRPPPKKKLGFLRKNEKCLELPDLARKLIRKSFINPPPPDMTTEGLGEMFQGNIPIGPQWALA